MLKVMKQIVTLLILVSPFWCNAESVYKTIDKDGNIIFTDRPSDDAEEIKLQELQTIKNPNPTTYSPPPKTKSEKSENVYRRLLITNPADGSGLRDNAGNVTVSVSVEPGLRPGHKMVIAMDGQEISNGAGLSVSLQNVDRGTHSITATVVDGEGKSMLSASSSFSLLRASR